MLSESRKNLLMRKMASKEKLSAKGISKFHKFISGLAAAPVKGVGGTAKRLVVGRPYGAAGAMKGQRVTRHGLNELYALLYYAPPWAGFD